MLKSQGPSSFYICSVRIDRLKWVGKILSPLRNENQSCVVNPKLKKNVSLPKHFVIEKTKFTKMYMYLNSTWIPEKIGNMHRGHNLDRIKQNQEYFLLKFNSPKVWTKHFVEEVWAISNHIACGVVSRGKMAT